MDKPNLEIKCLRCQAAAELFAQHARLESGEWRPVNPQRPSGWIQGPASAAEVDKGLCPTCAAEWKMLQEEFLAPPPAPESPLTRQLMTKNTKPAVIAGKAETYVDRTIPMEAPAGLSSFSSPVPVQQASLPNAPVQLGPAKIMPTAFPARVTTAKPYVPVIQQSESSAQLKPSATMVTEKFLSTPQVVAADPGPQPPQKQFPPGVGTTLDALPGAPVSTEPVIITAEQLAEMRSRAV